MPRTYRLGRRQAAVDQTHARIVGAARELVAAGQTPSLGAIARRAGVSRITVYNRFVSRAGLMAALVVQADPPSFPVGSGPRERLAAYVMHRCAFWARDPALHRHVPDADGVRGEIPRRLAEQLAEADDLRPGCSLKEAEDVIASLTSFSMFDRLHGDGRRPAGAVAEILTRLASGILAYHP